MTQSATLIEKIVDFVCHALIVGAMTLEEWRVSRGLSYGLLAKRLGASHASVVRRWCQPFGSKQKMIPNMDYMLRIIEESKGEVQPNDFYIEVIRD